MTHLNFRKENKIVSLRYNMHMTVVMYTDIIHDKGNDTQQQEDLIRSHSIKCPPVLVKLRQ